MHNRLFLLVIGQNQTLSKRFLPDFRVIQYFILSLQKTLYKLQSDYLIYILAMITKTFSAAIERTNYIYISDSHVYPNSAD